MKKILFTLFLLFPLTVFAEEETLTSKCNILVGEKEYSDITDDRYTTYEDFDKNTEINIKCDEDISNVYILYNVKSSTGIINDKTKIGENKYLHEFINIDKTKEINIKYDEDYSIAEIYLLDDNIPDWVERWETLDRADLMLFSSHADDEQLFFAGLMPTYINENKKIQVIYFTNHYNNTNRYHEQLEGLWVIGVKYYPIISTFPDAYSENLEDALKGLNEAGYSEDDAIKYEVDQIRRFKPKVVVGHDEKGEYSHGQHILNTHVLEKAITLASDNEYTKSEYKPHQINKLYLHLYDQNQIVLDYDKPLEKYNNKTAYEVSKEGFAKHYSQQYTWFTAWLRGENDEYTSATQITKYNPAYYGLYFTNVGEDKSKNNMFENIKDEITKEEIADIKKEEIHQEPKQNKTNKLLHNKTFYIGGGLVIISIIAFIIVINKIRKKD